MSTRTDDVPDDDFDRFIREHRDQHPTFAALGELHKVYEEAFESHIAAIQRLAQRIAALEAQPSKAAQPSVAWAGVWKQETSYPAGCLCTDKGSLWLATRQPTARPGHGDSGWRLIVKGIRGHAPDEDRS